MLIFNTLWILFLKQKEIWKEQLEIKNSVKMGHESQNFSIVTKECHFYEIIIVHTFRKRVVLTYEIVHFVFYRKWKWGTFFEKGSILFTVFENHRKSLIQNCERSEDKSSLKMPKMVDFGRVFENLKLAVKQCY